MTSGRPDAPSRSDPMARLAGLSPRRRLMLAGLGGAVAALGQAPLNAWPLTILGIALIHACALCDPGPRRSALTWWIGGTGYFAVALSWIVEPFLVDIARHGWMAPFALVFMATGMALFWGLAGFVARLAAPDGRRLGVATVLALTLAGALRGVIFTGFPWALPGHALIASPTLHLAQFGGAIVLSLIVLGLAVSLPAVLARPLPRAGHWALALALPVALGSLVQAPETATEGRPIVRLVQPNVPQDEKWDREKAQGHFTNILDLTSADGTPDVVVWPETAMPAWLEDVPHLMPVISSAAGAKPVIFGVNRGEELRVYNSLVLLEGEGEITEVYDKHHLVPFGEYVPFGDLLGRIGISGLAARQGYGFSAGPGPRVIDVPGLGRALPLICYEGVFPRDLRTEDRPEFLLLITNDAWFGTVSGPYQHLAQARLRAVEQGLPMIRVANTGISAMIDPGGRLHGEMALGTGGFRDVALPAPRPATPYAIGGDLPLVSLLILVLAALGVANSGKMRINKR